MVTKRRQPFLKAEMMNMAGVQLTVGMIEFLPQAMHGDC